MLSYNVLNSWVEKMMKKSLPVKIKTSDITNLSTKDINKLKAGDIVLKKTGNQKHTYIVSYKEENQGICLTYVDASVAETVSYDYNAFTKEWVYNSTDITPLEGAQYTAGDNITIDHGVISATDTIYTAGTGISITGNIISKSTLIYLHHVEFKTSSTYNGKYYAFDIISTSNEPFNKASETYIPALSVHAAALTTLIEGADTSGNALLNLDEYGGRDTTYINYYKASTSSIIRMLLTDFAESSGSHIYDTITLL